MGKWSNWAGNQSTVYEQCHSPRSEDEIIAIVKHAAATGKRVKAIGAGHSFSGIALADHVLLDLSNYDQLIAVDVVNLQVTVQSGMALSNLNQILNHNGLAMPNLGDIAYQSVAGAISTSTHGTGVKLPGLAAQVAELRIVLADSSVLSCNKVQNREIFECARVGLGAIGLISTVKLNVVPAFNLAVVEQPIRVDEVLASLDQHVAANDHFEFFWVPHTGWALTKRNNRTDQEIEPMSKMSHFYSKTFMENYAFGAVCKLGRLKPELIPKLAKALPSTGVNKYSDISYKVFASQRLVKFYEMEYAIPREVCAEALNRVRRLVDDSGFLLNFPIEVRFTAQDEIPLSTASNRESAYIAVHIFKGMNYEPYFTAVESIMSSYQGRPHWGKIHFQNAQTLQELYPMWDKFAKVRDQVDKQRMFTNSYLEKVLGK